LTTNATFDTADMNLPIHIRNCKGDPSEIAILKFVEYLSCDVSKYRKENPRFFEAPFNSFTKYQLSVHKTQIYDNNKDFLVVMKGAPEIIMNYCSEILIKREIIPLTKAWQRKIDECCKILGRLLGLNQSKLI
jgi:sodium/potassium-transporting ATPase subunit alpha